MTCQILRVCAANPCPIVRPCFVRPAYHLRSAAIPSKASGVLARMGGQARGRHVFSGTGRRAREVLRCIRPPQRRVGRHRRAAVATGKPECRWPADPGRHHYDQDPFRACVGSLLRLLQQDGTPAQQPCPRRVWKNQPFKKTWPWDRPRSSLQILNYKFLTNRLTPSFCEGNPSARRFG